MSRGFTEFEAQLRQCPFRKSLSTEWFYEHCVGARCMLWEWLTEDTTQKMVMLPFVVNEDVFPFIQEQDPAVVPAVSNFPAPEGEGWELVAAGPVFRHAAETWTLTFTRKQDVERRGVCGAARNGEAA